MPVIFSEKKRAEISRQIKETALKLFEEKGIRKTTVAELAASVGIAKGTFYNFYATKGQLVAEIVDDYNAAAERELRERFKGRPKMPPEEFVSCYAELFHPNTAFSFHFKPDDIMWMHETEETARFFSPEYAIKDTQTVLSYLEGIREDADCAYLANFAKIINMAIENRNMFCKEAFDMNLKAIFDLMLHYLNGSADIGKCGK